jgi:hypothetical protein
MFPAGYGPVSCLLGYRNGAKAAELLISSAVSGAFLA